MLMCPDRQHVYVCRHSHWARRLYRHRPVLMAHEEVKKGGEQVLNMLKKEFRRLGHGAKSGCASIRHCGPVWCRPKPAAAASLSSLICNVASEPSPEYARQQPEQEFCQMLICPQTMQLEFH
jgi:hypothetical protein